MNATDSKPLRGIALPDVSAKLGGTCRTQIHNMVERGELPAPVYVTAKKRIWLEHEIDAFLLKKAAERDAAREMAKAMAHERRAKAPA